MRKWQPMESLLKIWAKDHKLSTISRSMSFSRREEYVMCLVYFFLIS